jgi:MFS family permease
MHIRIHLNLHRLLKTKKELEEIYLNQIIRKFAMSMIGIFVPIYLITVGFSLQIALVFLFVYFMFEGIFSPLAAYISSRIGLKHIILYRTPFFILYFFLLILINPAISGLEMGMAELLLIPISALGGFSQSMYWVSLNSEFVKNSDRIHRGEEVSHLVAFPKLAAIIAPFLAGVILNIFGFNWLFILVIVILFISVIPLFLSEDYKRLFNFNFSDFHLFFSRHLSVRHFAEGFMYMAEGYIWPLFIFMKFNDIVSVGIAASLSVLGVAIFTLIVGRASDRMNRLMLLRLGGLTYAIVSFLRFMSNDITSIYLLSFLGGVFITLVNINVFANFCDYTKGKNILAGVSFRELWLGVGRMILILLVIFLIPVGGIETAFLITGVFALIHMLF